MEKEIIYKISNEQDTIEFSCENKKLSIDINKPVIRGKELYNQFFTDFKKGDKFKFVNSEGIALNDKQNFLVKEVTDLINNITDSINKE